MAIKYFFNINILVLNTKKEKNRKTSLDVNIEEKGVFKNLYLIKNYVSEKSLKRCFREKKERKYL